MSRRTTGLALALATAGISGMNVFLNGYAVRAFGDASLYTTAKNVVAALVLAAVLAALASRTTGDGPRAVRPRTRGQWVGLALVGAVGGSLPFLLFFEGLARATSTEAAFIHKTLIVWVAILAVVFLRERLGRAHLAAIALLVAGQAVTQTGLGNIALGPGELMIAGATLLWSVELVVAKRLLGSLSAFTVGSARMGIGAVLLVGYAAATGSLARIAATGPEQWAWVLLTGVLLALYVGTWYSALARAQAVDVTAILVSGAVVTALLEAAVRGRDVLPQVGGLALILAGSAAVAFAMWSSARGRRSAEATA